MLRDKVFFSYFVIGKLAMEILLVPFEENRYCFTDADEQNLKDFTVIPYSFYSSLISNIHH